MARIPFSQIYHPEYEPLQIAWRRWRLTYQGGRNFVQAFLRRMSKRETPHAFEERREITYCPAFAKQAVEEIKNAIYARLCDVSRTGGPSSYQMACRGEAYGVDLMRTSMEAFIGRWVLPELLSMGKVGVWLDNAYTPGRTLASRTTLDHPYMYIYRAEDIRSWTYLDGPNQGMFRSLLLCDWNYRTDQQNTRLPIGWTETYRHVYVAEDGVHVQVEDPTQENMPPDVVLPIPQIPFVVFQLEHSLLEDVADIQISLLQLASSDMNYVTKSNFPFYIEQYNSRANAGGSRPAKQTSYVNPGNIDGVPSQSGTITKPGGQSAEAQEAKVEDIAVGVATGRRYPEGMDPPSFIHPSSEPLKASMAKQEKMEQDIRRLVHLSVAKLSPGHASAESKQADDSAMENGLSAIASELQKGEQTIAEFWAMYEQSDVAVVRYPRHWSMKSDSDRREEAAALGLQMATVPSKRYQKEVAKEIARKLVGHKVTPEVMDEIEAEIDAAKVMTADPDVVVQDVENGLVSKATASVARGYAPSEAAKADDEHTERLKQIAISQTQGMGAGAGARGLTDLGSAKDGVNEKKEKDPAGDAKPQRGDGKGTK